MTEARLEGEKPTNYFLYLENRLTCIMNKTIPKFIKTGNK